MHNKIPRIGVYGVPNISTKVYKILCHILGYDPYTCLEVERDTIIEPHCGRAHKFGPHFTIFDIFTPSSKEGFISDLGNILGTYPKFNYTFEELSGYVRGDYYKKGVSYDGKQRNVLAFDFDSKSIEALIKLHTKVLSIVQKYRVGIEPEFNSDLFKNSNLWGTIKKYGAPYVLKDYNPHLTIASGLDGSEQTVKNLRTYVKNKYGKDLISNQIKFNNVYIYEEILEGKLEGYFKIIKTIPLK